VSRLVGINGTKESAEGVKKIIKSLNEEPEPITSIVIGYYTTDGAYKTAWSTSKVEHSSYILNILQMRVLELIKEKG